MCRWLTATAIVLLLMRPAAGDFFHQLGTGEIRDGDGRLVDDYSKQELVCALYATWWFQSQMTCFHVEKQSGVKPDPKFCGEDLRPKAEACRLTQ